MDNAELRDFYLEAQRRVQQYRQMIGKPLTLMEKVFIANLAEAGVEELGTELSLKPQFIGLQDATAQMCLLQFVQAGIEQAAVETAVFCDHLSKAKDGADADLERALADNKEVYDFLESVSARYGLRFHAPNDGIIHAIVLFSYVQPLVLALTTDSHGPNGGAIGPVIGVGGAEAVDPMVGLPYNLPKPKKRLLCKMGG